MKKILLLSGLVALILALTVGVKSTEAQRKCAARLNHHPEGDICRTLPRDGDVDCEEDGEGCRVTCGSGSVPEGTPNSVCCWIECTRCRNGQVCCYPLPTPSPTPTNTSTVTPTSTPPPSCGDGNLDPGEECDPPGCKGDGEVCSGSEDCCGRDCVSGTCESTQCANPGVCQDNCTCPDPTYELECKRIKPLDESGQPITDFSGFSVGDTVRFSVEGLCNKPTEGITSARFRINGSANDNWCQGSGNQLLGNGKWCQTTNQVDGGYYVDYQIPTAGNFKVESMVHNPGLGWK